MVNLNPKMVDKEIKLNLAPGETPDMLQAKIQAAMKENLFPDLGEAGKVHKMFQKLFSWLITKFNVMLVRTSPNTRRWFWFHKYLKKHALHKALVMFRWLFKKTLLTELEDIPVKPWNNLIRIWRYNKHESIFDIWRVWNYQQNQRNVLMSNEQKAKYIPEEMAKSQIDNNNPSYSSRKTYLDFETTMIIMDTADRARIEMGMLRDCHSLMQMYGISEEERVKVPKYNQYPLYLAGSGRDAEYFLKFRNVNTWQPSQSEVEKDEEKFKSKECEPITGRKKKTSKRNDKERKKD